MHKARPAPDDAPLPHKTGEVLHSSTRTSMSTNADSDADRPARLTISTTRLELRALGGKLQIRFAEHRVDGLPARPAANRPQYRKQIR
jgi:hypothetical protein